MTIKKVKKALTRERIIQVSYDYADKYGIEALSMRNIAESLGVKAMSLYNHVQNKEEIIDGLVDRVISEIPVPDAHQDWKEAMEARATSTYNVLLKHRWALLPLVGRKNIGPAMLVYFDRSLACLHNAGFSLIEADYALNAIDSYTYGFTHIQMNFPIAEPEYADTAKDHLDLIPQSDFPALYELSRLVIEQTYNGVPDFHFGLKFILDGLERIVEHRSFED